MNTELNIAAIAALLLAVTNPSKSDYAEWVQKQAVAGSSSRLDQALAGLLIGPVVNLSTTRENYLFFSIFKTELDAQHRLEAIGVASKLFIPLTTSHISNDNRNVTPPEGGNRSLNTESSDRPSGCFDGDGKHVILSRAGLSLNMANGNRQTPVVFDVVVSAVVKYVPALKSKVIDATEFDFFRPGEICQPFFTRILSGVDGGRVETLTLQGKTIIHLVGVSFGGSGNGYTHVILSPAEGGLKTLTPFNLTHSNMGGFFVGNLDGDGHSGIVLWDAIWKTGTHYAPHPYQASIYRWDGTQFLPPETASTTQVFDPSPDGFPTKMKLPFRDLTGQSSFKRWFP